MKKTGLLSFWGVVCLLLHTVNAQSLVKKSVPLDSIRLSDPCILADVQTQMYYMTGTGGKLWKSKDLKRWNGPYALLIFILSCACESLYSRFFISCRASSRCVIISL